jgi:hypothetical protein
MLDSARPATYFKRKDQNVDQDISDLADALESALSPKAREKFRQQRRVLNDRVFVGLPFQQFRPGDGNEKFFSAASFLQILGRCEGLRIGLCGLEVFTADWRLLAVEFSPQEGDRGAAWCHDVVRQWNAEGLLFAASYFVPDGRRRGDAAA